MSLTHALLALVLALGQDPAPSPEARELGWRRVTAEAAQEAAKTEKRALVLGFYDSASEAGRAFDAKVLQDAVFVRWLEARTVALRLDLASQPALARSLAIEGPGAVVVCTSAVEEVERWGSDVEPRALMTAMQPMLKHVDFMAPARTRVKQNPKSAMARALLGDTYIDCLMHDRAIEHYLWAWDNGGNEPEFAQMRREATIYKLGQMANRLKPVRKELVTRRDAATARLLAPQEGDVRLELARDVAALNSALIAPERQLETWNALRQQEKVEPSVLSASFPDMLAQYLFRERRFEEFLAGRGDVLADFDARYVVLAKELAAEAAAAAAGGQQGDPTQPKEGIDPLEVRRTSLLASASMHVEALASLARTKDAGALASLVLGVDRRPAAYATMAGAAARGNAVELHDELIARARKELTNAAELAQFESQLANVKSRAR